MRVYISVDLEGVNGVCHSSHTQPGEPGYERAIQLMHAETNAVIRGARSAGATDVVVNDSHWDMRNIRPELLEPGTTVVSGWQKPFSMVSQLGNYGGAGASAAKPAKAPFDVAFFVGYHAMAGHATGVLSHTYRAQIFYDVKLNGVSTGETGLNAALAGWFGVPVGLITGDDIVCAEATGQLGPLRCVPVKTAISRYSAAFRPQQEVIDELSSAAASVLNDKKYWQLFKPTTPCSLMITTIDPAMADAAEVLPMVKRVGDRTIEVIEDDYSVLFRLMLAIGALGASRKDSYF